MLLEIPVEDEEPGILAEVEDPEELYWLGMSAEHCTSVEVT